MSTPQMLTHLLGAKVEGLVLLASKVRLERVTLTLADEGVDTGNGLADRRAANMGRTKISWEKEPAAACIENANHATIARWPQLSKEGL